MGNIGINGNSGVRRIRYSLDCIKPAIRMVKGKTLLIEDFNGLEAMFKRYKMVFSRLKNVVFTAAGRCPRALPPPPPPYQKNSINTSLPFTVE